MIRAAGAQRRLRGTCKTTVAPPRPRSLWSDAVSASSEMSGDAKWTPGVQRSGDGHQYNARRFRFAPYAQRGYENAYADNDAGFYARTISLTRRRRRCEACAWLLLV